MLRIIVFVALLASFGVSGNSCKYSRVSSKYFDSCKKEQYLDDIFNDINGEVKADELVEQLTDTCSNYEQYSKCASCTGRHVCSEEQDKFKEIITDRWSIYCDEDKPADWLVTILQNGFSYNYSCVYTFINVFYDCLPLMRPEDATNDTSLTGLANAYRKVVKDVFDCSVKSIDRTGDCGSSWQDVLLANFLKVTTRFGLLFYIDKDDISRLETMRGCHNEEAEETMPTNNHTMPTNNHTMPPNY